MAGDDVIRCYVGFEPSGTAHIGWKVLALRLRKLLDAQANVMVFLADWHAWVNDKFSGDMAAIQTTARYMEDTFRALLGHPEEVKVLGNFASFGLRRSCPTVIIGRVSCGAARA